MLPAWRVDPEKQPACEQETPGASLTAVTVYHPATMIAEWIADGGEVVSAVGHADTAALFSALLGRPVEHARVNVTLHDDDVLLVGQITGGRLPEGATTLPDGVRILWLAVTVQDLP